MEWNGMEWNGMEWNGTPANEKRFFTLSQEKKKSQRLAM
jgi:hypothetical protein